MGARDPLLEKLELRERAEENVYFAHLDRIRIAKLREMNDETRGREIRELVAMRCPECGAPLRRMTRHGVTVEQCPADHGLWMTEVERRTLAERERYSWIRRYLYRPKPVL